MKNWITNDRECTEEENCSLNCNCNNWGPNMKQNKNMRALMPAHVCSVQHTVHEENSSINNKVCLSNFVTRRNPARSSTNK